MSYARIAFATLFAVLALSAPATAVADISPESGAMIQKVNEARSSNGLAKLQASDVLTGSARSYARYMLTNDYFGHLALIRAGGNFLFVGETLEWHSGWRPRVAFVFSRWMASPPHRAVLMSPTYRFIGTGQVKGRYEARGATAWVAHVGG
ncbi:MAG TPA: CAP domain-containing protein [Thermoleophilaceae bacterium]